MTHLSPEQLSALHDGALSPAELATAEAHLSACEPCRATLAELVALDESLGTALAHDPGDAYFADFAQRVQTRIAAEAAAAEVPPSPPVRPIVEAPRRASWFTPRVFGFAGAAAALVATAGLAWMMFGRTEAPADLTRASAPQHASQDTGASGPDFAPLDAAGPPRQELRGKRPDMHAEAPVIPGAQPMSPRPEFAPGHTRESEARAKRSGTPLAKSLPTGGASNDTRALADAPPAAVSVQEIAPQSAAPAPVVAQELTRTKPSADNATPAPVAQSERREVAPGDRVRQDFERKEQAAKPGASTAWGSFKSALDRVQKARVPAASPTPTLAPAPALPVASKDGGARTALGGTSLGLSAGALAIDPPCGVVCDSRGTPLGGAQLTLLGSTTRTTRSAKDGTYCLEHPVVGDTLLVMRVGFEPVRFVLGSSTALALALEPVGTLGSQDGLVAGRSEASERLGSALQRPALAPASDVYAHEPALLREAVVEAREAAAVAVRERTSEAWERAASQWRAIGSATSGAPSFDARFRAISALREALLLSPTAQRKGEFEQASAAYIAGTPRQLPEHATVQRWLTELRRHSK